MAPLNETTYPAVNGHGQSSHNSTTHFSPYSDDSHAHTDTHTHTNDTEGLEGVGQVHELDIMDGLSAATVNTAGSGSSAGGVGGAGGGGNTSANATRSKPTLRSRASKLIRRRRQGVKARGVRRDRKLFVEQHYNYDKENKVLLPGVPKYDDCLARDLHDFFNLIFLVPIVLLNILNWDWDKLIHNEIKNGIRFSHCWTGEYYELFFYTTVTYFLLDLLWILAVPRSVKSPMVIIQHHVAVFLYLIIPYQFQRYRFAFGLCMSVEINTWFLIARRVFNKQGFPPWTIDLPFSISVRVKLISVCFYITWVLARCILYPYVLVIFYRLHTRDMIPKDENVAIILGSCLQAVFCMMNVKWTNDLINSKIRHWRSKEKGKAGEERISSGL